MRWVASMVADVHRILTRGGVFMYPLDSKMKDKGGKLRLMYEANPMAMIVRAAGGAASTGRERILDIVPTKLHQRVPVVLGSKNEVERVVPLPSRGLSGPGGDALPAGIRAAGWRGAAARAGQASSLAAGRCRRHQVGEPRSAFRPAAPPRKHLGFIGEQAGEGLDEGRVALLRRARKEIASLLATEGYFTPSVEGVDAADDDFAIVVEPGRAPPSPAWSCTSAVPSRASTMPCRPPWALPVGALPQADWDAANSSSSTASACATTPRRRSPPARP